LISPRWTKQARLITSQNWRSELCSWSPANCWWLLFRLVVKLKSIFTDIEGLTDARFEWVKASLVEFYNDICEERPGVVAVRQSLKSLRALTMLDLRNQGRSSESSGVSLTVQEEEPLEHDLGYIRDVTSERLSGATDFDSSDSLSSSDQGSDAS
jgi:hypothetical protein